MHEGATKARVGVTWTCRNQTSQGTTTWRSTWSCRSVDFGAPYRTLQITVSCNSQIQYTKFLGTPDPRSSWIWIFLWATNLVEYWEELAQNFAQSIAEKKLLLGNVSCKVLCNPLSIHHYFESRKVNSKPTMHSPESARRWFEECALLLGTVRPQELSGQTPVWGLLQAHEWHVSIGAMIV